MISRRSLIASLVTLGVPLLAAGQPAEGTRRIGFLGVTSAPEHAGRLAAWREGLRDLGYDAGKNLVIEYRWAQGSYERLPGLAADLVRVIPPSLLAPADQAIE